MGGSQIHEVRSTNDLCSSPISVSNSAVAIKQISLYFAQSANNNPDSPQTLFHERNFLPQKFSINLSSSSFGLLPVLNFACVEIPYIPEPFSSREIAEFIRRFTVKLSVSTECLLATATYVIRAQDLGLELQPQSWRPIILACLLISLKLWKDIPYTNSSLARIAGLYTLSDVNVMEMVMARYLHWELHITAEEYEEIRNRVFSV